MSILENLKEVLPEWSKITVKELPYKIEYEIYIQPTITDEEHYELTPRLKKACEGKYMERYTKEIGEHFYIYTKK
jgi:hypothetical protein